MLGIILCGGESSRMGTDKGLLIKDQKTWTRATFEKLELLSIPVKISIISRHPRVENAHLFAGFVRV